MMPMQRKVGTVKCLVLQYSGSLSLSRSCNEPYRNTFTGDVAVDVSLFEDMDDLQFDDNDEEDPDYKPDAEDE